MTEEQQHYQHKQHLLNARHSHTLHNLPVTNLSRLNDQKGSTHEWEWKLRLKKAAESSKTK